MYKVTLMFGADATGWSESWYNDAALLSELQKRIQRLCLPRISLCGSNVFLNAVRISDTNVPGSSQPYLLGGFTNPNTERSDLPRSAILAFVASTTDYRRQVFLRGVPDSWIQQDDAADKVQVHEKADKPYQNFVAQLRKDNWCFSATERAEKGATGFEITNFQRHVSGRLQFDAAPFSGVAGEKIRIRGVKAPTGAGRRVINRRWLIWGGALNTIVINQMVTASEAATLAGGELLAYRPVFPLVNNGDMVRPMRKKTGRSFFSERGRSRSRA